MDERNPSPRGSHALVVGGSGMLRGASLGLAAAGRTVTVVGRSLPRLESLAVEAANLDGRVLPLPVDYRDEAALRDGIARCLPEAGPVDLAVCWIHSTAPRALGVVAEMLAGPRRPFRLFHVRGSAASRPGTRVPELPPAAEPYCLYRQVVLGFVRFGAGSRWLTHEEISNGVLEAIRLDREVSVVGVVEPWEERPG